MSDPDGGAGEAARLVLQSSIPDGGAPGEAPEVERSAHFGAGPAAERSAHVGAGTGGEEAREVVARVARRTFTALDPAAKGRPPGGVADWTVKHITTHFAEEITLDDLARGVQLSKFHFLRKFRKEVGMTPGAFLKRYRIVQAMERLTTTRRPIREVAHMVGYKDATAFSRAFIHFTGMQPYLFRETRQTKVAEDPESYG